MKEFPGATGLVLNEPLLWEKGKKGRRGLSLPRPDVPTASPDPDLVGEPPDFPDLSEVDVVRHYTPALHLELRGGYGHVPLGVLHHEVQSQDQ